MGKLFKREIGITLIALIITIIVMLILVAVTINVALNGGIFNNASDAKVKTQRQAEKEELISAMVGAYISTGIFATSNVGELPGGAKWCNEDTEVWSENLNVNPTGHGDWIITTNNNKFYIDESGSVLDEKPQNQSVTVQLTASQIVSNGMSREDWYFLNMSQLFTEEQIQKLKNNTTENTNTNLGGICYYFNNIACSDQSLTNKSSEDFESVASDYDNFYSVIYVEEDETPLILIKIEKENGVFMTDENYTSDAFKDITFTIYSSN